MLFLCNIANVAQRTIERLFKNRDHANIINYIDKNIEAPARERVRPETSTCEVPRDVLRKLQLSLCAIMAS